MIKGDFENKRELSQYLSENGQYLGYGKEGSCFLINHQVWKVYNEIYAGIYSQNVEDLTKYSDIRIVGFSFIRDVILTSDKKKLIASISDYASGSELLKAKLYLCQITKIINGLKKLETSVIKLSEMGIVINDLFPCNIIYDEGTFTCIDTNSYYYSTENVSNIYLNNMRSITKAIMKALFSEDYLCYYITKLSKYQGYHKNNDLLTDPIHLLRAIKAELENICGFELQNFASARQFFKRKKENFY